MVTPLPKWHVIPGATRQTSELKPGGAGFIDYEAVTYQIDDGPAAGQTREIRVPATQYNADTVRQAVIDDLTNAHGVNELSS